MSTRFMQSSAFALERIAYAVLAGSAGGREGVRGLVGPAAWTLARANHAGGGRLPRCTWTRGGGLRCRRMVNRYVTVSLHTGRARCGRLAPKIGTFVESRLPGKERSL